MAMPRDRYTFGWQGGEPTLLGVDFFKKVADLQKKYAIKGIPIANGLQTNGTLITEELAEHFAKYNFLLGVSLDGPPELHDVNRIAADGKGTHSKVITGIEILKKFKVEFNILILVNSENVKHAVKIYRYLRDAGFFYHQYIECVEYDEIGNIKPFSVTGRDWGVFLCELFDEWYKADTRKVSIRLFDSILAFLVDGNPTVCHMDLSCCQYFMIEYNGDVYPCDFYADPEWKLGNIKTDSLQELIYSDLYRKFGRRKLECSKRCIKCKYLVFCGADCQKNRLCKGKYPKKLSPLCEGWKMFYEHTLERFKILANQVVEERNRMEEIWQSIHGATGVISRNAPCPCGSGKKYKHCCGKK